MVRTLGKKHTLSGKSLYLTHLLAEVTVHRDTQNTVRSLNMLCCPIIDHGAAYGHVFDDVVACGH
jgi:hypothetical protein